MLNTYEITRELLCFSVTVRVHGDLKIEGGGLEGKYALQHFHFHWGATDRAGSEHWLDGVVYPLEVSTTVSIFTVVVLPA